MRLTWYFRYYDKKNRINTAYSINFWESDRHVFINMECFVRLRAFNFNNLIKFTELSAINLHLYYRIPVISIHRKTRACPDLEFHSFSISSWQSRPWPSRSWWQNLHSRGINSVPCSSHKYDHSFCTTWDVLCVLQSKCTKLSFEKTQSVFSNFTQSVIVFKPDR